MNKFLDYGIKRVLYKYIICIMKKEINIIENSIVTLPSKSKSIEKEEEEEDKNSKNIKEKYKLLFYNLEKVQGISYIKLPKKASKYGGEKLSMYLLDHEKFHNYYKIEMKQKDIMSLL